VKKRQQKASPTVTIPADVTGQLILQIGHLRDALCGALALLDAAMANKHESGWTVADLQEIEKLKKLAGGK
jgi:hypothetical protein